MILNKRDVIYFAGQLKNKSTLFQHASGVYRTFFICEFANEAYLKAGTSYFRTAIIRR